MNDVRSADPIVAPSAVDPSQAFESPGARDALIAQVRARAAHAISRVPAAPPALPRLIHTRTAPMIAGLFAPDVRPAISALVERSVVVLTPDTIAEVLRSERWLATAERLADLYLHSLGCEPLSADAPAIDGLSQDAICFLGVQTLVEAAPLSDALVHEVAHLLHTVRPETIGLCGRARQERLVDVAYRRRELFAYACEALGWLCLHGRSRRDRIELFERHAFSAAPSDPRVDCDEYVHLVRAALASPRSWSMIARHCAQP